MRVGALARGLAAGAAGTLAVAALEPVERAALGRRTVFAPAALASALFRRVRGRGLPARLARQMGRAMRWTYGPLLGAAGIRARGLRGGGRPAVEGAALGAGVFLFESVALPAVRATPPLSRWSGAEVALLGVQSVGFGVTAALALRALDRYLGAAPGSGPAVR